MMSQSQPSGSASLWSACSNSPVTDDSAEQLKDMHQIVVYSSLWGLGWDEKASDSCPLTA